MGKIIHIHENNIHVVFKITEDKSVYFFHCEVEEFNNDCIAAKQEKWFRLVEVQFSGEDQDDHHGAKYTGTVPGKRLHFKEFKDSTNSQGRKLEIVQIDPITQVTITSHMQFFDGLRVIESYTEIINDTVAHVGIEYVSSFVLVGMTKTAYHSWDKVASLKIPHNSWCGEFQWKDYTLPDLGLRKIGSYSTKRVSISSTGTWNSHEYIPMGYVQNDETRAGWLFSIVHNGSWHWEVSDIAGQIYLQISGPTENENHWYKTLQKGEKFTTVSVRVALTNRDFTDAVEEMTRCRRAVRRSFSDNRELPVIFNDFMNCLSGDPTEKKLLPLIDAAAEVGCEYFTIDAGWYANNGSWWSTVGAWTPSQKRFPNGIKKVTKYIEEKGMIPGLWLELEVMGIHSPLVNEFSDDCFFMRHGKKVIDHGRYQLDYRHPQVVAFANKTIQRLVEEYGVKYIKMDYNINAGIGTEINADSFGDGLFSHNLAYMKWLRSVYDTYPNLVIENCGSGGMRINDALLQFHSIQSSSDQTQYEKYSTIAAASPTVIPPEQNAVWSYPLPEGDSEQVVWNMMNAMTMRIHQSGHLAKLSKEHKELVKEGIEYYKQYRHLIPRSIPFWPYKFPEFNDDVVVLGFQNDTCTHIAVWNRGDTSDIHIHLNSIKLEIESVSLVYPTTLYCSYQYCKKTDSLRMKQPHKSARLFKISHKCNF